MPAAFRLHHPEALGARPVEVFRRVAGGAQPDLRHAFTVHQALLDNTAKGRAVGDLFTEHVVVDVRVGVHVDDAQRAVSAMQGAHYRQHDGVVATEGQGTAAVGNDAIVGFFDDLDAGCQVEGVDGDVADIGDLQAVEGRRPGRHVVGPDEGGLGANGARSETCAAAVRGADVQRHADEAGVESLRVGLRRQAHHGGRTGEARHLVAAERLVARRLVSPRHSVSPPRSTPGSR